jgi:hypothetical protein
VLVGATLVAVAGVGLASAKPAPGRPGKRSGLNMFALTFGIMNVNRVFCGINNIGEICVDPTNSPVLGGGFWPKGTPDQYVFNSGLQLAGTIPATAGFLWAGDTVGAYFMDPRDTQSEGDPITLVYNSLDLGDAAAWPNGAVVRDTAIYSAVLLGRNSVSQQDLWVRTWDGNPAFTGNARSHPMGVLVEERGMAWNFPTGNEDIIYFVYNFYNVTASNPAAYSGLDPAIQAEIAAVGVKFQADNEGVYNIDIPDNGYPITNMFAAFFADMDVGDAGLNYATPVIPFAMGVAYKADFLEPNWVFPPDIFGAPFVPSPGFIGVKYLRSPTDAQGQQIGLTIFSNTLNSAVGYPDPTGVKQLYRYLSGTSSPAAGDNPCTFQGLQLDLRFCLVWQDAVDTRFFQSSGPLTLNPGDVQTIVVAYINAAPLPTVVPFIGLDFKPGIPASGDSIAVDPSKVRPIERAMGWVSEADADTIPGSPGHQSIEQDEVQTVPRSLLHKALVAQAVYDNKFLLPFSPEPPTFYLVPGDNQVSVVWQSSETETVKAGGGDPYYAVASDPTSTLYDANFRQYDVEGYRIYRGRTTGDLSLVAQFDYAGTSIIDFTGGFEYGVDEDGDGISECAPELGVQDDCPTTFPDPAGVEHPLVGNVVQIPAGGRVQLANGSILILNADSAVTGGGFPPLADNGVPFAYVDRAVRNSFTYYYAVTAFDVNSLASGPSVLESARVTKSTEPRTNAPNSVTAQLASGLFGDDNVALDPAAAWGIDAATGRFTGPPPPTNALQGAFAPLVSQLLPALSLEAKVDSLTVRTDGDGGCPVSNGLGACYLIYVTFTKDGVAQQFALNQPWPVWTSFDGVTNIRTSLGEVPIPADPASVARFGIPAGFAQFNATVEATLREYIRFSSFEGQAARRGLIAGSANAGLSPGGSRWFAGADETENHPGYGIRVGHLPGTDTVWAPINHTDTDPTTAGVQSYANSGELQCFGYGFAGLTRQADVVFTWGAGGQIQSVRDITHHVNVDFKPGYQASYGFVGDFNGNGYIDFRDFNYVDIASQYFDDTNGALGFCSHTDPGPGNRAALLQQPVLLPVSVEAAPTAGTGSGFGLYVNGERYIVRLTGGTAPASGTTWTLRAYAGTVRSSTATLGSLTPSGYTYSATDRSPIIPGLKVSFNVAGNTALVPEDATTLASVHTVPDPYYVSNALEQTANTKVLKFVNLPPQAIIRIYSLSGVLVDVLTHNDPGFGSETTWNLRNRNNQFVASGVYFFHVETPAGKTRVGRFTVVNFAP